MHIATVVDDLRKFLPIQFPLGVFIHNNMLFSYENLPFKEGVTEASILFGANRALAEDYYQDKFKAGRIKKSKVLVELKNWAKEHNLPDRIADDGVEYFLWRLMEKPVSIPYRVAESSVSNWVLRAAKLRAPQLPSINKREKEWKRVFRIKLGEDVNNQFQPVFIRFISAYIDQGMSTWHNPDTHRGLLESFKTFVESNLTFGPAWMKRVHHDLSNLTESTVETWLGDVIKRLPYVSEPNSYLLDSMLELRGWAGMINKFETEPQIIPRFAPKTKLLEYLAIYLMMERAIHDDVVQHHSMEEMRGYYMPPEVTRLSVGQMGHIFEQLSDKVHPDTSSDETLQTVIDVAASFHASERAMVWQAALDLSMRDQCLDTLIAFQHERKNPRPTPKGRFYFCIDDREESIRRILEEAHPEYETHGVVGFFGIDMMFRSAHHPEAVIHCPPVVNPSRVVEEVVVDKDGKDLKLNRRKWGKGNLGFWYGSRSNPRSLLFTMLLGPATSFVLLLRVFFPHLALRIHKKLKDWIVPPTQTKIRFDAEEASSGGYSVPEMANIVATILKFTGTLTDFPDLNYIVGHGATSANNPYKNAYGCGACSGKAGIPNGQIFCGMANMPKVRDELRAKHNIDIPASAVFVACYHDTSTDEILFFNRSVIPTHLLEEADKGVAALRIAGEANSLERCRHFANARQIMNEKVTFRHVLDRAASIAEPRPEYGHNNTALTVIGRRELTRGLYLDRRSFLVSYDASTDPEGAALAGVLAGAVPVAGGISLDYYFSRIDNEVYGSGTKLPLNIASLLGVMTGSSSDLRIGLARQMVEIHEPVRMTVVVEAEAHVVERLINNHPRMKRMTHNGWINFALIHPKTGEMSLFEDGAFRPYRGEAITLQHTNSSRSYAPHRRGPLPFVVVDQGSAL